MRSHRSRGRTALAFLSMAALLITPGGALGAYMQVTTARPTPVSPDGEWPRRYIAPDASQVVVYEPQIASWEDQKKMTLYAAMSHTPAGADKPLLGTIMVEADTRVSPSERLVDFSSFRILQSNFPGASKEQSSAALVALKGSMPLGERVISLDRVLAFMNASDILPRNIDGVKADPPVIFFSNRPAVLVNIDGNPVWSPIPGSDLRYAVNTNWDLFEYGPTKMLYLRHETAWLKASSISGPWSAAGPLPAAFAKLPAEANWTDVRAAVPGKSLAASQIPTVFVSTTPAELILLRGEAQYQPVAATNLLWVRNTDSDVFRLGTSGPVYYLVAGRWFSAPGFNGPWTFATPTLPPDFARIPPGHDRSRVLASVPGTSQAAEAVLLAQVPQTARVSKKVQAPDVAYQGAPDFQAIESTSVARAINTDKDILKVGDLYYLCFDGVWFVSRSASGPWEVTGSVPQEIYQIPISSPSHHVTYVTVEDDDDDWVVYASAAAYTGMMVAWGCAVWGTGWYYPPYVGYAGYYPAYFPHYPTYGYNAWYNPWSGTYGRGAAVYGPYGGAGVGARYNPRTGTYARGAAAYGPYGARGAAQAYNPRTGTYAATRQAGGAYGSWGATGVSRGDEWAATARRTRNVTGTTSRVTRTAEGGAAVTRRGPQGGGFAASTAGGDVYAGRDGNVYRKSGDSWQRYDTGGWNNVGASAEQRAAAADRAGAARSQGTANRFDGSTTTMGQLDRDAYSRSAGAQRARDASRARSGGSSMGGRAGSIQRGGMGAARAGGGRRR
jgi:hypothetical protein